MRTTERHRIDKQAGNGAIPCRIVPPPRPLSAFRLLSGAVRNPIETWPAEVYQRAFFQSSVLGHRYAFVSGPDLIKQVLVDQADRFEKGVITRRALQPALGDAILTSDGAKWRWQRRIPVRGVVTVGDSVDPDALRPAHNVAVFATADHDDLMSRASLVVTHGGHGTFMRALKNGLPMVVIPGLGGDQPINGAAAEKWGVGRALPAHATAAAMHDAVQYVLNTPRCRANAQEISAQLIGTDGAAGAVSEMVSLLPRTLRKAS
jgi:EryCIII-like glycosyltransferase